MNPYWDNIINFEKLPKKFPPQHQSVQPGIESIMVPSPIFDNPDYKGSDKLKGKSVLITGAVVTFTRLLSQSIVKNGIRVQVLFVLLL